MIQDVNNPEGLHSSQKPIRVILQNLLEKIGFRRSIGAISPRRILVITIGGIVLAESFAMVFVYFIRDWPYLLQVAIDATIMTIVIFPVLYLLTFKPLLDHTRLRNKAERITQARLRLLQFTHQHPLEELLQFTIDEIEALTESAIGFFHFVEADQKTLWLQSWSTNTLRKMCQAEGKDQHYDIENAGVWADAVRQKQPVIHNQYSALLHRKGTPSGHAPVERELVIPILRNHQVVSALGVGNKRQDYTAEDVEIASTLADFAWDIIEQKRTNVALQQSEQKFRTLVEWTYDWEQWMDPDGNYIYSSPACERITGYTPEEFFSNPELVSQIIHPDDRLFYLNHLYTAHKVFSEPLTIEYRIIARDGSVHAIEHICRPLYGPDDQYLGRRISNRDITHRKKAEQDLLMQRQKEMFLTQMLQTIQNDIARDLHDTLGQNISFMRLTLVHLLESQLALSPMTNNQIQNMTRVADESYELIRTLLVILQSGDSADPLSLFARYAKQVANRSSFQLNIHEKGKQGQLSSIQIRHLFYIFREALSNIEKYAAAEHVSCEFIWDENRLTMMIADDGRGFDFAAVQAADHYGLRFMQERSALLKGSLHIQSAPNQGTMVKVVVPYEFDLSQPAQ